MSNRNHREAIRTLAGAQGDLPQTTILTSDNYRILLTQQSVLAIANHISEEIQRGLRQDEVQSIVKFVTELPQHEYYKKSLQKAQKTIAHQFIRRNRAILESMNEEDEVGNLTDLKEITDTPTMSEYQVKEIEQYSNDENPLVHTLHPNRRGNALIDAKRDGISQVMGDRSSPDNIKASGDYIRDQFKLTKLIAKYLKIMVGTFGPENVEERELRVRKELQTFQSVALPRNQVPLDSRFRKIEYNKPSEYRWDLHPAGMPGNPGDVQLQDTIQQIMQFRVQAFWIPVTDIDHQYYQKIRLLVKEFKAQSWQGTEFTSGGQVRTYNYHFEFNVERDIARNRFLLIPTNDGVFTFKKPIARVETITIMFMAPFETIIPVADRLEFTVSNTNPAVFTSNVSHNLSTGDLVYVMNYAAGTQALNDAVNRDSGYIITRLNSTQFSIPVDLTSVAGPAFNVLVHFGSKRVLINMEFISLMQ